MAAGKKLNWLEPFSNLREVRDSAGREVLASAQLLDLPAHQSVFHAGDHCSHYILLIDGQIKVQKLSGGGREILLYRILAGQGCVLTTSCLLGASDYPAEAITELPSSAALIPVQSFQYGLDNSPAFRQFVFASYGERLAELIGLVESVAFGRLDARLATVLLKEAGQGHRVERTHSELATYLGTAREVVSRYLKDFERRGWVGIGRGRVDLLDRDALRELVEKYPV